MRRMNLTFYKEIAERIKKLQPEASNRQIAKVLGVDHKTVAADVGGGENSPQQRQKRRKGSTPAISGGENSPPSRGSLSGAAAAKAVESKESRDERKAEKEKKIAALTAVFSATVRSMSR